MPQNRPTYSVLTAPADHTLLHQPLLLIDSATRCFVRRLENCSAAMPSLARSRVGFPAGRQSRAGAGAKRGVSRDSLSSATSTSSGSRSSKPLLFRCLDVAGRVLISQELLPRRPASGDLLRLAGNRLGHLTIEVTQRRPGPLSIPVIYAVLPRLPIEFSQHQTVHHLE